MKLLNDLEKEQKSELYEILIGAALLLLAWIAPITGAVRAVVFIAIYISLSIFFSRSSCESSRAIL